MKEVGSLNPFHPADRLFHPALFFTARSCQKMQTLKGRDIFRPKKEKRSDTSILFPATVFAKALLETALERAGDEDSADEEEMAKEEDQNAFSVRIIGALNARKSTLTTH